MNWFLVALLSSFGLVMGALSLKGYTLRIEPFLWLFFACISALVLSKNVGYKPFLHGLIVGILWGFFNGLCQCLFFDQYLAANSVYAENFNKVTFMPPRFIPLLTGPVIGTLSGLVVGGLTLLAKKLW